ncbi:hypothetical protein F2Q69_00008774 [Brassica cretica]|uniref:Uncharacterized protein n=1 Tax=Brassica cretica TaxID=69181 RepID=A0A8S9PEX2_BRACR|nr:hypothetical protein F2Q69_00008774 [Brassica cretica]
MDNLIEVTSTKSKGLNPERTFDKYSSVQPTGQVRTETVSLQIKMILPSSSAA